MNVGEEGSQTAMTTGLRKTKLISLEQLESGLPDVSSSCVTGDLRAVPLLDSGPLDWLSHVEMMEAKVQESGGGAEMQEFPRSELAQRSSVICWCSKV